MDLIAIERLPVTWRYGSSDRICHDPAGIQGETVAAQSLDDDPTSVSISKYQVFESSKVRQRDREMKKARGPAR